MQLLQNSQGCNALLDAAADVDQLCCWLPELDEMAPVDDASSSLSDWMVGLSPRMHHNAAAGAAPPQASMKAGTLGAPPSVLKTNLTLAGPFSQVSTERSIQAPLGSPLDSSSAGNSSNSGSCSTQGVYGQLAPGVPQQHLPTFQQQQQPCMDYCCPAPYSNTYGSSSSFQLGPVNPSSCWPSDFSTDVYAAATGPSPMAPGAATANYYTAGPYTPAAGYYTGGPYGMPAGPAPYPGPAPGSCLPAAAPPAGAFDQGFPVPAFSQGLDPAAAAAFHGMPAAGYSCGPVSYPPAGPFTGGHAPMQGYEQGLYPMQPPMQAVLPGSCAGPCCAYPPAACMDSGPYYCPAAMPAQGPGFLSGPLVGQHSSSGMAGHHCSSRSSTHEGLWEAVAPTAAAGGGGAYPASVGAGPAGDVAGSPAASTGNNSPSAAVPAASSALTPAGQHTPNPVGARKQQQHQHQRQVKLDVPVAAARPATQTVTAAKAAKSVAAAPKVKLAGAAVRMVQSGGVSKLSVGGTTSSKPLGSKAMKKKLLEQQQQCVMLDSAQKIKELAERRQKLSAIAEQLQESRDRAAAALAKLRGQYETMTADNARLRADNADILALINDIKARLNVSA